MRHSTTQRAAATTSRRRIISLGREPLVHFLLIGAALFLCFGLTSRRDGEGRNRIVVTAGQVEQLAARFTRTWLRPPTEDELSGLIESHVRDEVYYREALAMGLDRNDPLIRRRMRQKLEFILEDLTAEEAPTDDVLSAFLKEHSEKFAVEGRISFRQLYLNPEKRPDPSAAAETILERLHSGVPPETLGDSTLLEYEYSAVTPREIARVFGEEFARQVAELEPGAWSGPLRSGLGEHLVWVGKRSEGRLPELDEIRPQVEREWLAQRRQELKDLAYQKLCEGYEVIVEPPSETDDASRASTPGAPYRKTASSEEAAQ